MSHRNRNVCYFNRIYLTIVRRQLRQGFAIVGLRLFPPSSYLSFSCSNPMKRLKNRRFNILICQLKFPKLKQTKLLVFAFTGLTRYFNFNPDCLYCFMWFSGSSCLTLKSFSPQKNNSICQPLNMLLANYLLKCTMLSYIFDKSRIIRL